MVIQLYAGILKLHLKPFKAFLRPFPCILSSPLPHFLKTDHHLSLTQAKLWQHSQGYVRRYIVHLHLNTCKVGQSMCTITE